MKKYVFRTFTTHLLLFPLLTGCGPMPEDMDPTSEEMGGSTDDGTELLAQALTGEGFPAANEVLICPAQNYGGNCAKATPGFYRASAGVNNDTASSLKVGMGVRLTLCQAANFGGVCETFSEGTWIPLLTVTRVGNDTASSMRVVDSATPRCDTGALPPGGWAFVYRDPNFSGDCVALPGNNTYPYYTDMGMPNDSISSVRVGVNTNMMLHDAVNLSGETFGLMTSGGAYPSLGSMDNRSSSGNVWTTSTVRPRPRVIN